MAVLTNPERWCDTVQHVWIPADSNSPSVHRALSLHGQNSEHVKRWRWCACCASSLSLPLSPSLSLFPHLSGVGRCTRSNFSGAVSGSRSSRQKSPLTTQQRERETVTPPVCQYPTCVPCYPLHVLRLSLGLSQSSRRHQSGGTARDRGDHGVPPSAVRPVTARPTAHCTVAGRFSDPRSQFTILRSGEMDCVTPPVPVWASSQGRSHLVPRGAALCFMDAVWCRINTVRRCGTLWDAAGHCGTLWDAAGHCGTVTRFTDSPVVVFGAVSRAVAPADLAQSPATER